MLNSRLRQAIDLHTLQFSLLVVTCKPTFQEWVQSFARSRGLQGYKLYLPEEDSVWVIPPIEQFSMPGEFQAFLEGIKPRLLLAEIQRFGGSADDFSDPMTAETFDEYMEVAVRERADSVVRLLGGRA